MHASSSDDDTDDGIPITDLGTRNASRKRHRSDSEESYDPNPRKTRRKSKKKKNNKTKSGRRAMQSADDESEAER